jgi:RsiW-degrading membrane proteinase PrsW (M82 family)
MRCSPIILGDLIRLSLITCGKIAVPTHASIVQTGVVEEVIKFLPVLVILNMMRRTSEPFDLVV